MIKRKLGFMNKIIQHLMNKLKRLNNLREMLCLMFKLDQQNINKNKDILNQV